MDILKIAINSVDDEVISSQIKAYIVLINNCKINGEIINYLLVNCLIDQIIKKYIKSVGNNTGLDIE
jgi:hypothetical protein